MTAIVLILLGIVAITLFVGFAIWSASRRSVRLQSRLSFYEGDGAETAELTLPSDIAQAEMSMPFTQRFLYPLLTRIGGFFAARAPSQDIAALRQLLDAAGRPDGISPSTIFALQFALAILAGGIAFAVLLLGDFGFFLTAVGIFLFGAVAFMLPRTILKRRVKERHILIEASLPDVLDLLTVCVEAGLTLEPAMRNVTEKLDNELCDELRKALVEYGLGQPFTTALREMSDRIGVRSLQAISRAIAQSDRMGTSLGQILRIQAETVRRERRNKAQEAGQKAPVKMLIPMVGCIFPTIFIMLIGPAAVHLIVKH